MNSKLIKKEGNEVSLQVTVSAKAFQEAIQKSYLKNRKKFNIPGFRKGKTPRKIIESQYGEGVFYDDAINFALPAEYDKAIEELNIDPVDRPDVNIETIEPGKDLIFDITVTVRPEVNLADYKGIEVEKIEYNVSDEDIDAQIDGMREANARLINIEDRPVAMDDSVIIDYKGYLGEELFAGGSAENQTLEIGSGRFIPGFEEQLIGSNVNDEVDVNVTFPEEYQAEHLAGKEAIFKVKLNGIKKKELPQLDDEFAKDVSEFDTLEELKNDLKTKLMEDTLKKQQEDQRNKILDTVVEKFEIEIPNAMVDSEIDTMLRDFDFQLRYQGIDLEKYLEFTGGKIEDLKEQMKEDATGRVKTSLVLDTIADAEKVEVTEEDIEEQLAKLAESNKTDVAKLKESFNETNYGYIRNTVKVKKTIDLLVDNSKLV